MSDIDQCRSEVARLLAQIDDEYEAAKSGLTGLAQGVSQHSFINARMEQVSRLHLQLRALVGDEAIRMIDARLCSGREHE